MVSNLSLVLFKGIIRKQLTKKYNLKKFASGCMEGALSGCCKAESLRTGWYVLSKTKIYTIITEILHICATCFILCFLLKVFFKTFGEPLYLLTVHLKLIFRGALKKALMVLEDQYYQRQYFVKIFPSPLALMLQIHFYPSPSWIILDCPSKVMVLKSATFSAPESAHETNLETTYFMLFLKNLTKNLEKKVVVNFVWVE